MTIRIVPGSGHSVGRRPRSWDWPLVLAAASLAILGAALIWSATSYRLAVAGAWTDSPSARHVVNLVLGLGLCWGVARLGHRTIQRWTPTLYGLSLIGLILVLSPMGSTINGAHAWIRLPAGFTVQPSEFAKVAVIVAVALALADPIGPPGGQTLVRGLSLAAVPAALVLLQPDLGTVLVIGAVVAGMLALSGVRAAHIALLSVLATVAVAASFVLGLVDQYQVDRLTAFASPQEGGRSFGYNTQQARIAIGAGGWLGQGLGHGSQTQGGFVPFNHTDFVFSVAGEELGFLGVCVLLGLLGLLLWRGLRIALAARDLFGRLVASGVVLWFGLQSFENIGMNLGITPVTGVPLLFVSYGGSSMFAAWIGIGLLLNIHADSAASN